MVPWPPRYPREEGGCAQLCVTRGGDPLEDYRNFARQHLAFFHASTCQDARWRMIEGSNRKAMAAADTFQQAFGSGSQSSPQSSPVYLAADLHMQTPFLLNFLSVAGQHLKIAPVNAETSTNESKTYF